ncbi:MAG: ComF family protein [Bacteroides sp.]|nr:ComF family protein [Bacteroides sp.]
MKTVRQWFLDLFRLLFPPQCVACGMMLEEDEECLCKLCLETLPRTQLHLIKHNYLEVMLRARFPLQRITAFFYHKKEKRFDHLIHQIKYNGRKDAGIYMGKLMAEELEKDGFFKGIEVIVPVPLHPHRQRKRGYNQSDCLAQGISTVTGIPLDTTSLIRSADNQTQVHQSRLERLRNVKGIFRLTRPGAFTGKHILLVDDVLTTGSTISACAEAFHEVEDIHINVLTLSAVDRH